MTKENSIFKLTNGTLHAPLSPADTAKNMIGNLNSAIKAAQCALNNGASIDTSITIGLSTLPNYGTLPKYGTPAIETDASIVYEPPSYTP